MQKSLDSVDSWMGYVQECRWGFRICLCPLLVRPHLVCKHSSIHISQAFFIKVAEKLYGHKISVKFDDEQNHIINAIIIALRLSKFSLYYKILFNTLEVTILIQIVLILIIIFISVSTVRCLVMRGQNIGHLVKSYKTSWAKLALLLCIISGLYLTYHTRFLHETSWVYRYQ